MKRKRAMKLTVCIHNFFTTWLRTVKGASPQTDNSYKIIHETPPLDQLHSF